MPAPEMIDDQHKIGDLRYWIAGCWRRGRGLHCGNERVTRASFLQARDVIYAEHKRSAGVFHPVEDGLFRNLQLQELDHVLLSQDLGGVQQRTADYKNQKR